MAASFEIIQYEVQVFQDGHWHVRARFPRSDREYAFTEARRVDLNDMLPARVVRDIYDPQSGRSQESTIFMSDRAKTPGVRDAVASTPPRTKRASRAAAKGAHARLNEKPAPLVFRATMALGVGLVTALLVTSIATWMMTPQPESFASVLARTPSSGTPMTVFGAVMLFSVFTLLRGPLGITRLARSFGAMREQGAASPAEAAPRAQPRPKLQPQRTVMPVDAEQDHDTHLLSLARATLARFFTEGAPANAAKAVEDTLGRRGLALYLAGAASQLASHLEMPSPGDLLARIAPDLLQAATKDVLAEARDLGMTDTALLSAGRSGMQKYVSVIDERPSMAAALVTWHTAMRAEAQMPPMMREMKAP
ncbi:MAG: hypothetical protein LCH56_05530 [Proteobacteria bacterium]|nr:hypothetical protein [Pseudomonadota bacterium]